MNLLLHTCCGPCTIYPLNVLREEGVAVTGFFYRHNIHPYTEMMRRQEALDSYAAIADLVLIHQEGYDLEGFIRGAAFRESERCRACYHDRLLTTAKLAKTKGFDAYSSTLLYSRYQNHDLIREMGETIADSVGVSFIYRDFRSGWREGIETSKRLQLYRQQYCGCIYSEKERYVKRSQPVKTDRGNGSGAS
jgi:predicted adenine nucleotide alpha hydrolase (AANH) superfamily ATPase